MRPGVASVLALAGGCVLAGLASAQDIPFGFATARSHSGQFVVSGRPQPPALPETLARTVATNWIPLQPTLLAMTCERVKDALLLRLGARDQWQGKVTIILRPLRRLDDPVRVTQTHFKDGWAYRVEMPDALPADRLVKTIVQVLVVERANRHSGATLADVPLWLVEGLGQTLLAEPAFNLVLQPPGMKQNRLLLRETSASGRQAPPLAAARAYFTTHEPLDFEELCWPSSFGTPGAGPAGFSYSAELFVSCLLRLRDGGPCLALMLEDLGRCRNWQTAFLLAFSAHFSRTLDVDKWWALEMAHFLRRGGALTWRPTESLRQLNAVLTLRLLPSGTNAPASGAGAATVPLTAWLAQASPRQQEEVLPPRLRELEGIMARLSPSLAPLADEYVKLFQAHLRALDRGQRGAPSQRLNIYAMNQVTRKLVGRLETLDARRARYGAPDAPPGAE